MAASSGREAALRANPDAWGGWARARSCATPIPASATSAAHSQADFIAFSLSSDAYAAPEGPSNRRRAGAGARGSGQPARDWRKGPLATQPRNPMADPRPLPFDWADPFALDAQLTDEERLV